MSGTLVEEIAAGWQGESPCDAFRHSQPQVAGIEQGCQDCGFTRHEHLIAALLDAHQRLAQENARLREEILRRGWWRDPGPCAICGYDGENYYQPETHACARLAAALAEESNRAGRRRAERSHE